MKKLLLVLAVLGAGCETTNGDIRKMPPPETCGNGKWEDTEEVCDPSVPASCKGACLKCRECVDVKE
jgi:hypothetical protein